MTRLYQNKLVLKERADNVLPELEKFILTTSEGDSLVSIGAMVVEPGVMRDRHRPPATETEEEKGARIVEYQKSLASVTWVSLRMSPSNAIQLARQILRLVDDDGRLREPRSIGILKGPDR